jgi:diguanylate cyclase (GGDEF)-like protein
LPDSNPNSSVYPEVKNAVILLVDDDKLCTSILSNALQGFGKVFEVHSGRDAIEFCEKSAPDLIVLDSEMPELNGWQTCEILRQMPTLKSCPIIFSSAKTGIEDELKCWDVGGSDFIPKPVNARTLIKRIYSHIMLKLKTEELEKHAFIDGLTELYNRRFFNNYYEQQLELAKRNKTDISLLVIDIDLFKRYSDCYGLKQGDTCLRSVANIISGQLRRPTDIVVRYGSEEFVAILPDTGLHGATKIASDISLAVKKAQLPHMQSPHEIVTVSTGVASLLSTEDHVDLLNLADSRMHDAKERGLNIVAA